MFHINTMQNHRHKRQNDESHNKYQKNNAKDNCKQVRMTIAHKEENMIIACNIYNDINDAATRSNGTK